MQTRTTRRAVNNRLTKFFFTPCTISRSLLEAEADAAEDAASSNVELRSPACSSLDEFRELPKSELNPLPRDQINR